MIGALESAERAYRRSGILVMDGLGEGGASAARPPECPDVEPPARPDKTYPETPAPVPDRQPLRTTPEAPVLPDSHPEATPGEYPE